MRMRARMSVEGESGNENENVSESGNGNVIETEIGEFGTKPVVCRLPVHNCSEDFLSFPQ